MEEDHFKYFSYIRELRRIGIEGYTTSGDTKRYHNTVPPIELMENQLRNARAADSLLAEIGSTSKQTEPVIATTNCKCTCTSIMLQNFIFIKD
jgi:hypothetical protein